MTTHTPLKLALASALILSALNSLAAEGKGKPEIPVQASGAHWRDAGEADVQRVHGKNAAAAALPRRYHAATLDRAAMAQMLASAPHERSLSAKQSGTIISLPHPLGGYQRFTVVNSPVMEEGLAARHPEIRTYAGRGIDDPSATLRMDITPIGLHASVRSPNGAWYVDPAAHLDDSIYTSYHSRDLPNRHGAFKEGSIDAPQIVLPRSFYHAGEEVEVRGAGFAPGASVSLTVQNEGAEFGPVHSMVVSANQDGVVSATFAADPTRSTGAYAITASDGNKTAASSYQVVAGDISPAAATGTQLRTYRLALLSDPSYANYFGGGANVTAAKVSLINRVTQVYEDETSIRLVLIGNNDALNLDTDAQMTGANGPCGANACYTASQASGCSGATLNQNRTVIGLLAGAGNFDVGHIALGLNGGGIASLGVVGGNYKAQGCTGIPTPVGDFYAVDYVAHEMGHQFAGNHTFNGTSGSCAGGNRNAGTSVEPGSGSSIMAYAGICGTDDLQRHSDAYWSQRSFDEITAYTSGTESNLSSVQLGVLRGFSSNGQQFTLSYNGNASAPIIRGSNYSATGIKSAIQAIPGWPASATVSVSSVSDAGFTATFGGALAGVQAGVLQMSNCTGGCSGSVGEIVAGGSTRKRGVVSATGNSTPAVTVTPTYTIPVRTPFVLTGSASNAEGEPMTYLWEQNDRAASSGTALMSNSKSNGPLFRQFGLQALVSDSDALIYGSPGENMVTTSPTRSFPDMAQILANNTNAETGSCPTPASPPSVSDIACYSEFLPTASYTGYTKVNAKPASLNFRLTARDGHGGAGSAATRLVLAAGAGPFLVTAPNTAVTLGRGAQTNVTWNVANTAASPVSTANVKISLSTDGGQTFPYVLAASTPNNGSKMVTLPAVSTTAARIKVEAIGNIFFDVSNANFTIN
ncbi:M12 family metallo-peptidase [Pseudoduganella violaceinigra]|uniref:M12 family metallo-peptidase n=1 Tax=Pseudoduganella violaceinigra TaxID=246602 RepID=UPI0004033E09|nr:M12 family metallo-peptidase [Pseudoduganella violaceinigra]